ncbi:secretion-regulating guanine nucleotide exchange factor isoform X1 [Gadus chalcogrammus]|uniref:secretion-regulating guanine nucleotide exchange factor isoform X1 n=1 Tax=Gadus chalcogrammus TaxID=1042646 RepID=UPI0024C47B34|nr:secretion-regulating guanine nucleotide exchange factor isoform X1 [Gadus chalcogrammus]
MEFCLYAWGANSYGQLGRGDAEDLSDPRRLGPGAMPSVPLRVLRGGGGHTVAITEDGEVWSCGQNHRGQLGLGHTSDLSTLHPGPALKQRVVNVSCGWDFTLFLTDCGQVLTCGSNAFGQLGVAKTSTHSAEPVRVESLGEPVVSVAAGLRHALAVTDSGCVYQWGLGLLTHARRAVGPNSVPLHFNSRVPVRVPGFDHVTARTVAAGSAHCVCLTGGGDVFLWGSNKYGQLTTNDCFSTFPALLNRSLLDGEAATHVWSGWTHLVAKTESGKVFTWGRGNYGQLGRTEPTNHSAVLQSDDSPVVEDVKEVSFPGKVDALYGAEQIACGSEHNLAIVGNRLFCWGWNEHGMCGDGSLTDLPRPQPVSALRPVVIGCGAGHSLALCAMER